MNISEYYFQEGCTNCGGEVEFNSVSSTYSCKECGVFASAHRQDSEHAKKGEPFQYLADKETNNLRRFLDNVFNALWRNKMNIKIDGEIKETAIINVIYNENVRAYTKEETRFVKIVSYNKQTGLNDIYFYDDGTTMKDVASTELSSSSNRQKAYLWLSQELNINPNACKIGYLSKSDLKKAIQICTQNLNNARLKAARTMCD